MTSQPRRQCRWCTSVGHNSDRCYAKDPANLLKYPHSSWVNGEPPEFLKQRYYKCFSQQEAQSLVPSKKRPQTSTLTPVVSTSPDLPTSQGDQVTKSSDWLKGISWRRNWFS
jgi:hypothetical protein